LQHKISNYVTYYGIYKEIILETIALDSDSIDVSKVATVKRLKRRKIVIWITFILFGWSYGSLGKLGLQLVWYTLLLFTSYNLFITLETNSFDVYSGMAIMGSIVLFFWYVIRIFTLNSSIEKFNQNLADFYYLTPEERAEVGIA
jgi:hypothetical protein